MSSTLAPHRRGSRRSTDASPPPASTLAAMPLTYFRGRVALAAILRGLGIGPGDEVAVQAFTCVAVPEGVMATGATPVYADIGSDSFNVDAESLSRAITPATRAIVVQHTFGTPAQMPRIMEIASEAGLAVVEDCCHDMGTTLDGHPLGSFGVASFTSFEWGKPVVAGLGGEAVVRDAALRQRLAAEYEQCELPSRKKQLQLELQYLAFGLLYRPQWYWRVREAFHQLGRLGAVAGNFRSAEQSQEVSPEFSLRMSHRMTRRAIAGRQQLPAIRQHSRLMADAYRQAISSSTIAHPNLPAGADTYFARYPLRVTDKPRLLAEARQQRIELAEWYRTVIHPLEGDQLRAVGYEPGSCPQAEQRASEIVSLPTHRRTRHDFPQRAAQLLNQH